MLTCLCNVDIITPYFYLVYLGFTGLYMYVFFCYFYTKTQITGTPLRKHPHMFYTPSFTLSYSIKGEMRGTQNECLFSDLD